MHLENWDLVVIGAGAAGLAAGVYGARSGLRTIIIEEKLAGGTTADAPLVENYLGFQSVSGIELSQKMVEHARSSGVTIKEFEGVDSLRIETPKKTIQTQKETYTCRALIIASGSHYRPLDVPGEKEFRGRGVSYCGLCDGPLFKGKHVLVVGGGNSALITAHYLADLASQVEVVHRRETFRAENALVQGLNDKKNVEVLWNTELKEITGEKVVERVVLLDNRSGETKELLADGVFVQIGEVPNSEIAREANVAVDKDGYIIVDDLQRTNISGVYAAGDVTNCPVKQIGTAVGHGTTAAVEAHGFIRRPYYRK